MFGNMGPSISDIAAVTDNNRGNSGWGGDGGWWVLIILLALFGGFGRNGLALPMAVTTAAAMGSTPASVLRFREGLTTRAS